MINFRRFVRRMLFLVSGLVILSGYGITHYQVVEKLTLGYLDKAGSFQLHGFLAEPFIFLLLLHIALTSKFIRRKQNQ